MDVVPFDMASTMPFQHMIRSLTKLDAGSFYHQALGVVQGTSCKSISMAWQFFASVIK